MLNARYIASLSDDIVKLYANLESEIKADMCKRIKKLGKNTDSIQWQADILSQTGALKSDIDKYITRYNEEAQKLVKSVFDEAMNKASSQDIAYYSAAKRELDSSQKQILETSLQRFKEAAKINKTFANRKKAFSSDETYEALQRMTLTVADSCQKKFLNQMNKAYMKVSSGAYSYDEAVKDAVDYLADRGVTSVFYTGSGRVREYSIESAVRMNVITGINQTASLQTLNNCEELGTDLVEVSAHIGARPEHEAWQGKIYSLSGNSSKYPAFSICRLGEADGICGINCRHSYYPYFEGTDPRYSKGELDEMSDKTVKLDNKDVTPYEAEQELRYTERQIRYWKDKVACYQYAGIDESDIPAYNAARAKLGAWQKRAQDICSETKIKRDYSREYIGTKNGIQPRGAIIGKSRSKTTLIIENNNKVYTKYKIEEVKNELCGVKKTKPMNFFEALKNCNPDYELNTPTSENCQSCIVALKARLEGFNLTAKAYNESNKAMKDLSVFTNLAFIDNKTNTYVKIIKPRISYYSNFMEWLTNNLIEDNLYSLGFEYKGEMAGAHVLAVIKHNNKIKLYDPQIKKIISRKTLENYLKAIKLQTAEIYNISNCKLNKTIAKEVLE